MTDPSDFILGALTSLTKRLVAMVQKAVGYIILRAEIKLVFPIQSIVLARRYERSNLTSRRPLTSNVPVIVSLTTYGRRFDEVHLAIESLAAGAARPSRIILWVDDPESIAHPTPGLQRLVERGLEILLSPDLGSHKKYYAALSEFDPGDSRYLVTADDDFLYPRWWLERLWRGVERHPGEIICHRVHRIGVVGGRIAPYTTWKPCYGTQPGARNFGTSGAGVALPPLMIEALRREGLGFLDKAPKADDVWLNAVAVTNRIPLRQSSWRPRVYPPIPGSQMAGLYQQNVLAGANDTQIAACFTPEMVATLVSEQRV